MPDARPSPARLAELFLVFIGLGLTSFGGPVAHLGYFRTAFVTRRRWLDETAYAELVAFCQFLPGPASSQVGIAIGRMRAGLAGAVAAWVGFTLPSVLILYAVALGADLWTGPVGLGILHGLKLAALAVVAQAVWQMGTRLAPDGLRRIVALAAALAVLSSPLPFVPVLVIAVFAAVGAALPAAPAPRREATRVPGSAMVALAVFAALLIGLPLLAAATHAGAADIAARFYRTGALVFGGGHVVLPLLQNELVRPGLIDRDLFLAGYGAAQAVPGPLFSFAFYAGAMLSAPPNGWLGGLLALGAIYLPSFLLVFGALPWWDRLKTLPRARRALDLANAAVVGLLLAALYTPVFTSAVGDWLDLGLAGLGLMALLLELPPVLVVVVLGAVGALFAVL